MGIMECIEECIKEFDSAIELLQESERGETKVITIESTDAAIEVAAKIATATIPFKNPVTGKEGTTDMFDLEEIAEIADYLKLYVKRHKSCED